MVGQFTTKLNKAIVFTKLSAKTTHNTLNGNTEPVLRYAGKWKMKALC